MKKLFASALLLSCSCLLFAQSTDQMKENFKKDNPNAMNIVWKTQGDNTTRVTYSENKMEHAIVYDKNGNITSRQTIVKDNIPAGITEYYTKRAAGTKEYAPSYTVWQSTDQNGNVTYYSENNGKQAWFDKDGKQMTRQGVAEGDMEKQDGKMPVDK